MGKELDDTEWRQFGQDKSGTFRRRKGGSIRKENIMTPGNLQTLQRR
jgi:hypothetical protein